MSEPTVSAATGPPKKAKKKLLGLPVPVVIGGVAALAAFGYIWWRDRHKTGFQKCVGLMVCPAEHRHGHGRHPFDRSAIGGKDGPVFVCSE